MTTTLALAIAGLDAAETVSAKAVGTYLETVGRYYDIRESEGSKAVSTRRLAESEGITESQAAKALAMGEAVSILGMPAAIPETGSLQVLTASLGRLGTILGKPAEHGGIEAWRDMISAAPEGADAWHVIDQAARQAGKKPAAEKKPADPGKRLSSALSILASIDGATLSPEDDATLKAVADAVNVIVRARVAAREAAKAA